MTQLISRDQLLALCDKHTKYQEKGAEVSGLLDLLAAHEKLIFAHINAQGWYPAHCTLTKERAETVMNAYSGRLVNKAFMYDVMHDAIRAFCILNNIIYPGKP